MGKAFDPSKPNEYVDSVSIRRRNRHFDNPVRAGDARSGMTNRRICRMMEPERGRCGCHRLD
jgi:hypothetical protein